MSNSMAMFWRATPDVASCSRLSRIRPVTPLASNHDSNASRHHATSTWTHDAARTSVLRDFLVAAVQDQGRKKPSSKPSFTWCGDV
ncbi:hypothetical protein VFPPC_15639 [Pochonia chlamydosporia 170]|uniref:Uncharacterized protein n=1 Tax=Pochonia chlamydosporia 170 TaxID=1380566 RepID=A0A179G0Y7_METCM|nr:hypothetical protein VFPPC_15639 [Pochonia chlamydosporia 170]OAQ70993.1 hypothetical protein VFPPC_15639 [Pochonia chlamydosporia 170]